MSFVSVSYFFVDGLSSRINRIETKDHEDDRYPRTVVSFEGKTLAPKAYCAGSGFVDDARIELLGMGIFDIVPAMILFLDDPFEQR